MIRTRTTLIVGAGASAELQLPGGPELLSRVAQGFDFSRFGTDLQTRDSTILGGYLGRLGAEMGKTEAAIMQAAERIRAACKLNASVDSMLEQNSDDPLVVAAGKLAIIHFVCQAEARSILRLSPRAEGDLPVQGTDNWLFQLAQVLTAGIPKSNIEKCFNELTIVSFNYDRSIEHFLPFALAMAYGITLMEGRDIVATWLNVIRPYGSAGRLPWQPGDAPAAEWGSEQPQNIIDLAAHIRTSGEAQRDQTTMRAIRAAVSGAERLVFLGFGFHPQNLDMLMEAGLSSDCEVLATTHGMTPLVKDMVLRILRRKTGIDKDGLLTPVDQRAFEMVRDFSLLLES
ncbi:MAG: hypothetical protein M0R03_05920 [Novosphingobium sp.]|nr:hypothetical protein [Novosphingobium sp.]